MDEMIVHAINGINVMLASCSYSNRTGIKLRSVLNLLHRILESNSPRNDSFLLFCRQLKRLMKYNKPLSVDFWIEFHDDIIYALEGPNGKPNMDDNWQRVLERIKSESKLEQREFQFQQMINTQKTLNQLVCENKEFFDQYLQKCISFHSKMQVRGLLKNLDDLLGGSHGLTDSSFTQKKQKLEYMEISYDCSNRALENIHSLFLTNADSYGRVNNNLSNFLPSAEVRWHDRVESKTIKQVLQSDRWLVILGDPGSAKTTLLRWITLTFAERALHGDSEVVLEGDYHLLVRIPILIRIGEFATWLDQHQTKTLIDYIGEQTWFSERYCHDEGGSLLKELIYNGHALILLDGLDEILEVGRRGEIVNFVRNFVDEYVRAPDFFSAFDNKMFNTVALSSYRLVETQPPKISGGNQIVITSRIVGYRLYPLMGSFIQHYALLLMDHQEAKKYAEDWMSQVEKSIFHILHNEEIKLDEKVAKTLFKRRSDAVQAMFKTSSELLVLNPSLLSLMCTSIFQSPNNFDPKSRIEVYYHAVQAALRSWTTEEPNISETVLTNFLINLSTYLHLESPSGLIDAFDMRQLCCFTLKQQGLPNDRRSLLKYADQLIYLLTFDNGIVAERGLEIYGFLHLSFQEYFVSQSFIGNFSVSEVAKRITTFLIHPRFRESLLLAFGWISWKWSFDDYDKFCNLLVTSTADYALPLGTLLFFDALNDIRVLPFKSIIFTTLNIILDHPSTLITRQYLISNLSKLSENILRNWMVLHLNNNNRIFKFCQCLLFYFNEYGNKSLVKQEPILSVICQQLRSSHNGSSRLGKFVINQTLQRTMMSKIAPNLINELFLDILPYNIPISHFHPLILSVIITVCGGISFRSKENIVQIHFSPSKMHRKSSIIPPIIKYLANNKEPHSIKVRILIKQYKSTLEKASRSNTSDGIVDTFIALICLEGVLEPLIYLKYDGYEALPLAIDSLKRTWFFLNNLQESITGSKDKTMQTFSMSEVETIINVFVSQFAQSDEECLKFSLACAAALDKLRIKWSFDSFTSNISLTDKVCRYLEYQPEFSHFEKMTEQKSIYEDIDSMQIFSQEPYILLMSIPQSLQKLYYCMIIAPTNNTALLPLVVLLSQCLIFLEGVDTKNPNFIINLSKLHSQFEEQGLGNYASIFIYPYDDYPPETWDRLIGMERKRICNVKNKLKTQEKDLQLFAASISLARIFQVRVNQVSKCMSLSTTESEEVYLAVMDISDPVLRIIALSIVFDMKNPLIFDDEQRNELRSEMINQLQSLLPHLSLLIATLLFVRCYSARQLFPVPFRHMVDIIGKKLNETSTDIQNQDQEAAFIALQKLHNTNLSHSLLEFAKRTTNLSNLFHFNSSILFRYFTNAISIDSLNTALLSAMYLAELAFDIESLKMSIINNQKHKIWIWKEGKELWNDSSNNRELMTCRMAIWITNYLKNSNKTDIHQIVEDVSRCSVIERKALVVMEKWLEYRRNKYLKFFAQYAAWQLIIEGSNMPQLIGIINEMYDIDYNHRLEFVVRRLFCSQVVNLITFRQILIILNRNVHYCSNISAWIDRREIIELILNLEFEQITLNMHGSFEGLTKPFLSMIDNCSYDLQLYLVEHLRKFINKQDKLRNSSEEKYVAVVAKWIIESSM